MEGPVLKHGRMLVCYIYLTLLPLGCFFYEGCIDLKSIGREWDGIDMGISGYWVLFICSFLLLGLSGCSTNNAPDLELAVQPQILEAEVNLPIKLTVTLIQQTTS
jgi:hypothetical protein